LQILLKKDMENDRVSLARNFINAALKAKKLLRIYPANNTVYRSAINESYAFIRKYLDSSGDFILRIKPKEILVGSEQVYQSSEKIDNLALFFFKDGIKELVFKEGLSLSELEEFLKLLGMDFDRDDISADFVSSMWEKGFANIKLMIDDLFFQAGDGSGAGFQGDEIGGQDDAGATLEGKAPGRGNISLYEDQEPWSLTTDITEEVQAQSSSPESGLLLAYKDALSNKEVTDLAAGRLLLQQRGLMVVEASAEYSKKTAHLAQILVEMFMQAQDSADAGSIVKSFEDIIAYSIKDDDFAPALIILRGIEGMPNDRPGKQTILENAQKLLSFCKSSEIIAHIGRMLDSSKAIDEEGLLNYARGLGKDGVETFVSLLEVLQSISARRKVNDILIQIGKDTIEALVARLEDPTWYVVRNIVFVLRHIGNEAVLDDIMKLAKHAHPRVRLEVVKALNDFRNIKALHALKEFFHDSDSTVRLSAITGMGAIARDNQDARLFCQDAIIETIKGQGFEKRDFREKLSFYEALASSNSRELEDDMIETLKRRTILGIGTKTETRACAAYYLGLIRSSKALPLFEKLQKSSEPLVREQAVTALRRMEHA